MSRTVGALRPRRGLALDPQLTIAAAAKKMQGAKDDAGLVCSVEGGLLGILTDTDVTRKVLALGLDPETMLVSEAMTANPQCVKASDNAVDALTLMVERRFRHLPVVDDNGAVLGLLDIAKCLYDAISRLEKHLSSASSALSSAVRAALPASSTSGTAQQLADGMVQRLFSPSLGDLLQRRGTDGLPTMSVNESASAAAELMAARRSAIIVSSPTAPCAGIVTPKDLLFRLVATGAVPTATTVQKVMTASPDTMPSTATVLEALHQLQYGGYRNVPVLSPSGEPLGVLDVLTLVEGALLHHRAADSEDGPSGVSQQMRGLFTSAESLVGIPTAGGAPVSRDVTPHGSLVGIAETQRSEHTASDALGGAKGDKSSVKGGSTASSASTFLFKVTEPRTQHMHRIHAAVDDLAALTAAVSAKLSVPPPDAADNARRLVLRYDDDEGDRVLLSSDGELKEACAMMQAIGKDRLVVHASYERPTAPMPLGDNNGRLPVGGSTAAAAGGVSKTAARLLGGAIGGMSEQERIMGAGAILATMVLGIGALAGRR